MRRASYSQILLSYCRYWHYTRDTFGPAGLTALRRKTVFLSIMVSPSAMQPNETTQIAGKRQAPAQPGTAPRALYHFMALGDLTHCR